MKLMEINTKRVNVNISKETFDIIEKEALKNGRKAGSMARYILDNWAKGEINESKDR